MGAQPHCSVIGKRARDLVKQLFEQRTDFEAYRAVKLNRFGFSVNSASTFEGTEGEKPKRFATGLEALVMHGGIAITPAAIDNSLQELVVGKWQRYRFFCIQHDSERSQN